MGEKNPKKEKVISLGVVYRRFRDFGHDTVRSVFILVVNDHSNYKS